MAEAAWLALDPRARDVTEAPVVAPADDIRATPALLGAAAVFVHFPVFRDGRGYSTAAILREAGYAGDIRAIGDLTLDQLVQLKRAGFSSVAADVPIDPVAAHRTLARFGHVYQGAADGRQPAWQERGGTDG
jgi:uncharacterized protein (DUF934 family)